MNAFSAHSKLHRYQQFEHPIIKAITTVKTTQAKYWPCLINLNQIQFCWDPLSSFTWGRGPNLGIKGDVYVKLGCWSVYSYWKWYWPSQCTDTIICALYIIWLVFEPPLWKIWVVSWDEQIPNIYMEKQKSCSKPPTLAFHHKKLKGPIPKSSRDLVVVIPPLLGCASSWPIICRGRGCIDIGIGISYHRH